MIPQKELEGLLQSRLNGILSSPQLQSLLAEIKNLADAWEEVDVSHKDMGYSMSINCPDICWLADQIYQGAVIRMYRKKKV